METLGDRIQFCRRPGSEWPPLRFRVPTPQVPFDLIRSWMGFCKRHNGPDCSEGGITAIQSRRVIDCEPTTRGVLPFSPDLGKYVALSYVWGNLAGPSMHCHFWGQEDCPWSSQKRLKTPLRPRKNSVFDISGLTNTASRRTTKTKRRAKSDSWTKCIVEPT